MPENFTLSCIVPVYNEHEIIGDFIQQLVSAVAAITPRYEILIVDDGSDAQTKTCLKALAQNPQVSLLALSRNFGKEAALTAGLNHCIGDAAILIDGDFQHPLEMIPKFVEQWQAGYDMVYGVRENRENESWFKRVMTKLFYRFTHAFTEVNIPANAGDFRLLDRKVIDAIKDCDERNRFMKGLYAWVGFKSLAVPYHAQDRAAGTSQWHFKKLTELAITGITSFSTMPLRMWSLIGLIISSIAFLYAGFIIFKTLIVGIEVPGYATIIVAIMFFGGIQLLSIGILGEYIAKIFTEVKKRPTYLIAEKSGVEHD